MTSQRSASAAGTDPGSRSSAELEREVRASRADVERTLDELQDRLSPGQFVDQAAHYLRDNGVEIARNFGDRIKQAPVPAVLVGVGLAWMMLAGSSRVRELPRAADLIDDDDLDDELGYDPDEPADPGSWATYEAGAASAWGATGDRDDDQAPGFGERVRDSAASAGEGLSEAAGRASAGVGEAVERTRAGFGAAVEGAGQAAGGVKAEAGRLARGARGRAAGMRAGVAQRAHRTGARARRYREQAREGFLVTMHRHPLVLGAVGLAIGAAIGAALPPSRPEDELMGDTSDQLRQSAKAAAREEYAKAKTTASAAYAAAEAEAEQQGLSREGLEAAADAARHKAGRVAEAATEAARQEADRQDLGGGGELGGGEPKP